MTCHSLQVTEICRWFLPFVEKQQTNFPRWRMTRSFVSSARMQTTEMAHTFEVRGGTAASLKNDIEESVTDLI